MADREPVCGSAACGWRSPDGRLRCRLGSGHEGNHADGEGLQRTEWPQHSAFRPGPLAGESEDLFQGCTAREWAELYSASRRSYQRARSEADDALGRVAELAADLDRLHHTPSAVEESLRSELRRAVGDRNQARDEAARLARQVRQGAQSPAAVETLSEVRHLFALAGELRGALAKFAGGR